jgi:hypothetical protein
MPFYFWRLNVEKKGPTLWNFNKVKLVELYQRKASFSIYEAEKGFD